MIKENVVTQEKFDVLLTWLDHNRETAAEKYEKIRARLIRIFMGRGCYIEAEALADETFNRVTQKLPELSDNYIGEPSLYFYGVADKLHLEWLRKQKKISQLYLPVTDESDQNLLEIEYKCLKDCLEKLPAADHRLIVRYYKEEKSAKIENRRQLAEVFGVSAGALQIRASRIRGRLKVCVKNCIAGKF